MQARLRDVPALCWLRARCAAMDPAAALFDALDAQPYDPARFERAVAGVRPLLERGAQSVAHRNPTLLEAACTELEDVVQELTRKIFSSPPSTRGRPEAVLVGWAKVVARNHLLDLAAKRRGETDLETAPVLEERPDAERSFDARAAARQLERCAEELTDRYRTAYDLLREDAEMPRLELARRLGILPEADVEAAGAVDRIDPKSPLGDRLRKAQANAWAVVSRVRTKLAECLDRHGMLEILPDTMAKLRRRRKGAA